MTDQIVRLGPEYFPRPTSGMPVSGGSIYIGDPDTDPEIPANQITVNALQENGLTVPISQPILTGGGGVPLYNGSPVTLLVSESYSLKVLDAFDVQVYYVPETIVSTDTQDPVVDYIKDLIGLINVSSPVDDQTYAVLSFFDGLNAGGGSFYWDSTMDKATADGGTIIDPDNIDGFDGTIPTRDAFLAAQGTGVGFGCWIRQSIGEYADVTWFGADNTGAYESGVSIQSALDAAITRSINNLLISPGVYLCSTSVVKDNFSNLNIFGYGAIIDFRVDFFFSFGDFSVDGSGYYTQTSKTVSNVKIKGLEFEPQIDTFGDGGTNRWGFDTPVRLSSSENVAISDCTFRDWDFSAIDIGAPSKEIAVRNCRFISSQEAIVNYGFRPFCFVADLDNYNDVTGQLAYPAPTVFHEDITMEGCYTYQVSHSILSWNVHRSLYINNTFEKIGVRGTSVTNWNFDSTIYGNKYIVDNNTIPVLSVCIRVGIGCQRITISNETFSGTVTGIAPNAFLKVVHIGAVCRDITVRDNTFDCVNADNNVLVDDNTTATISGNRFLRDTLTIACVKLLGDSTGTKTFDQPSILIEDNYVKEHDRFVSTSYEPIGSIGTITIRRNTLDTLLINRLFASDSVANWIVSAYDNDFPLGTFNYEANFGAGDNDFIRVDKLESQMTTISTAAVANVTLDWRDYGGEFWYIVPGMAQTLDDITNDIGDGLKLVISSAGVLTIPQGNFRLNGSIDFVMGASDQLNLISRAGFWFETGRGNS